ncbi:SNAP receptor PEP12 NDAI_0F00790 [Naumovozyma dairenensis CBS 421]|uniref:t-SNARE coiled-coil homology domain-containing protein n=1 Tax=Naumovozyma dairenensis (strain ATCC 10597 / BCRC 20456 / CBS 421 / NBRC 0211 / NRRL Y-12639) TaxID=1071378 RepID=G0WC87_NAUDC|nr:hypothetical protein NDAI_0F00790 [Naumovozyma dairenensis CBS 421]CCD25398.1 hypothetical protein NDAI_0F00790 [Naumovozyma dairenensis CBS 421]
MSSSTPYLEPSFSDDESDNIIFLENNSDYNDGDTIRMKKFSDSPIFESLKDSIAAQLFEINGQISTLQQFSQSLQKSLDDNKVRTKIVENVIKKANLNIHKIGELVKACNEDVTKIDSLEVTTLNKLQLISREKLLRDFKSSLQEFQSIQSNYTKLIKQINEKTKLQLYGNLHSDANETALLQEQEEHTQPQIHEQQLLPKQKNRIVIEREPINNEEFTYQQNLIEQRNREITNIEQDITELNEIFKDLSNVVQQQGLMVDNIESNIYSFSDNTQMASQQLNKARKYQRHGTKWCLYLLIALSIMLVFLLLIVFI